MTVVSSSTRNRSLLDEKSGRTRRKNKPAA